MEDLTVHCLNSSNWKINKNPFIVFLLPSITMQSCLFKNLRVVSFKGCGFYRTNAVASPISSGRIDILLLEISNDLSKTNLQKYWFSISNTSHITLFMGKLQITPDAFLIFFKCMVNIQERKRNRIDHTITQLAHIIALLGVDRGHLGK